MKGDMSDYLSRIPKDKRVKWPKLFHLSSGGTRTCLQSGAEAFGWASRWKGWDTPAGTEGPIRRGVGVGTGAHVCGVEFEGQSNAMVRINPDGSVKVHVSVGRQGQGSETTQCQVAGEELGVPVEMVEIETGDTDSAPWNHGSLASSTMFRSGWATRAAAKDARRQLLAIAAREFFDGIEPADLDIAEGVIHARRAKLSNRRVTIAEVLNESRPPRPAFSVTSTKRPWPVL